MNNHPSPHVAERLDRRRGIDAGSGSEWRGVGLRTEGNLMYAEESLNDVSKEALVEMLKETHAALCGLLWQIEDMRNFDDLLTESHFDDTIPMERAQYVHKVLMSHNAARIAERGFMRDERDEFDKWIDRCDVARSFLGAEKVLYNKGAR